MNFRSKHGFETTVSRSKLMSKIKSRNTLPEIKLRKYLWSMGCKYRCNVTSLPGKPDIVISKAKLVIFIDGEFWHGYNWSVKKKRIISNRSYWIPKIERNMNRDKKSNKLLREGGWKVLRFWENQINKDFEKCTKRIFNYLHSSCA